MNIHSVATINTLMVLYQKVRVGSSLFLMRINASSTIGPILLRSNV